MKRDIFESQQKPHRCGKEYDLPPLVVINNFSSQQGEHWKLASTMLQGSFPPIDINKVLHSFPS